MEETKITEILKNIKNISRKNDEVGHRIYTITTKQNEQYEITLGDDNIEILNNKGYYSAEQYNINLLYNNIQLFFPDKNGKLIYRDQTINKIIGTFFADILGHKFNDNSSDTLWDLSLNDFINYINGYNQNSEIYFTLLRFSCESGSEKIFKHLMNNKDFFNKINKMQQRELTSAACYGGNCEIIHLLEENNFEFTSTALVRAMDNGNFKIFEYLISQEIKLNKYVLREIAENNNSFPLDKYYEEGVFDTIVENLKAKLETMETENNKDEIERIQKEIKRVENIEKKVKKSKEEIDEEIEIEYYKKEIDKIEEKFKNKEISREKYEEVKEEIEIDNKITLYDYLFSFAEFNIDKNSLIFDAIKSGNFKMFKSLVRQFGIARELYSNLLFLSIKKGNCSITKILLEQPGIEKNFIEKNNNKSTPLSIAVENNNFDIVELLLEQPGIKDSLNKENIIKKNERGRTILSVAIKNGNYRIVELLLKQPETKEILNEEDFINCTPLFIATQNNNFDIVELLLKQPGIKDSLIKKDNCGNTPLSIAVKNNNFDIVELLLKQPGIKDSLIKKDNCGNTPLSIAVKNNNFDIVELLLKQPGMENSLNEEDELKRTPFFIAVENDNFDMVKLLLRQKKIKETLNRKAYNSYESPLYIGIKNNNYRIVELLLQQSGIEESFKDFDTLKSLAEKNKEIFALLNQKQEELKQKKALKTEEEHKTIENTQIIPDSNVFVSAAADIEHHIETENSNTLTNCEEEINSNFSGKKEESNGKSKDNL